MYEPNSRDELLENFLAYIDQKGLSSKNLKNYKSDISKFKNWLILAIKTKGIFIESLTESASHILPSTPELYRKHLSTSNVSSMTINRMFSTLRHFARFLRQSQILDFDFMAQVQNDSVAKQTKILHPSIIEDFRNHLEASKVSKNTIKGYLSDIKQFMSWLESKNVYPTDQS